MLTAMPDPITALADAAARTFLTLPSGPRFDFSEPAGEAALIPPDSVSWRVFSNPLTLYTGGIAAVVMEFADPRVRDGVWQHSTFRTEPLARLKRTGLAAMITVYGARSKAEPMIAGVTHRHRRVTGRTAEGDAYDASDPDLLDWVQATATYGFMQAYYEYAQALSRRERDAVFEEALPAAQLYGATGAPRSHDDFERLIADRLPRLQPSPIVHEFLSIMATLPGLPWLIRPWRSMLVGAALEIVPTPILDRLSIPQTRRLSAWQKGAIRQAARAAERLVLPSSPVVQACRRLGLPDNHVQRRRPQLDQEL